MILSPIYLCLRGWYMYISGNVPMDAFFSWQSRLNQHIIDNILRDLLMVTPLFLPRNVISADAGAEAIRNLDRCRSHREQTKP